MEIIKENREMEKRLESSRATIEKLRADLDYIQIMTGVEIPTDEEVHNEELAN